MTKAKVIRLPKRNRLVPAEALQLPHQFNPGAGPTRRFPFREPNQQVCGMCGCDGKAGGCCSTKDGRCRFVEPGLCSACLPKHGQQVAAAYVAAKVVARGVRRIIGWTVGVTVLVAVTAFMVEIGS